jgi:hypothetical protein
MIVIFGYGPESSAAVAQRVGREEFSTVADAFYDPYLSSSAAT